MIYSTNNGTVLGRSAHRFKVNRTALMLSIWALSALPVHAADFFAGDRLLATGGVTEVEGAGGGGIVPWALITGLGTRDQVGASAFYTSANPTDFTLSSAGVAVGLFDRVEVSFARQRLGLGTTVPGEAIRQEVAGLKVKLFGDAVFTQNSWVPQVALGIQHKRNQDFNFIPKALGARRGTDNDYYLAATKLYLDAIAGRNLLLNVTLRATRANQLGLLGFGGDKGDAYKVEPELSAGVFLHDRVIVGTEYRAKPDNLSVFREDSFKDVFLAWLPSKHFSITAAYAWLGNIADKRGQRATYISLQGSF